MLIWSKETHNDLAADRDRRLILADLILLAPLAVVMIAQVIR